MTGTNILSPSLRLMNSDRLNKLEDTVEQVFTIIPVNYGNIYLIYNIKTCAIDKFT